MRNHPPSHRKALIDEKSHCIETLRELSNTVVTNFTQRFKVRLLGIVGLISGHTGTEVPTTTIDNTVIIEWE